MRSDTRTPDEVVSARRWSAMTGRSGRRPRPAPPSGGDGARRLRGSWCCWRWSRRGSWLADRQLRGFLSALDEQLLGQATRDARAAARRASAISWSPRSRCSPTTTASAPPCWRRSSTRRRCRTSSRTCASRRARRCSPSSTAAGKVTAVTGAVGLREVNLGASPAVKAAFDRPDLGRLDAARPGAGHRPRARSARATRRRRCW